MLEGRKCEREENEEHKRGHEIKIMGHVRGKMGREWGHERKEKRRGLSGETGNVEWKRIHLLTLPQCHTVI